MMLEELPLDMEGIAKTPAINHLFNRNLHSKKLSKQQGQSFHHIVARLVSLIKCINMYCCHILMYKSKIPRHR